MPSFSRAWVEIEADHRHFQVHVPADQDRRLPATLSSWLLREGSEDCSRAPVLDPASERVREGAT